jgi:hypothetical protein
MTAEEGLNLAGVETVLDLERQLERARVELSRVRKRAAELERQMLNEVARAKGSLRAEIVPYGAYDVDQIIPAGAGKTIRIPVKRTRRR